MVPESHEVVDTLKSQSGRPSPLNEALVLVESVLGLLEDIRDQGRGAARIQPLLPNVKVIADIYRELGSDEFAIHHWISFHETISEAMDRLIHSEVENDGTSDIRNSAQILMLQSENVCTRAIIDAHETFLNQYGIRQ